jgi:hypothetical protein
MIAGDLLGESERRQERSAEVLEVQAATNLSAVAGVEAGARRWERGRGPRRRRLGQRGPHRWRWRRLGWSAGGVAGEGPAGVFLGSLLVSLDSAPGAQSGYLFRTGILAIAIGNPRHDPRGKWQHHHHSAATTSH